MRVSWFRVLTLLAGIHGLDRSISFGGGGHFHGSH